MSFYMCNTQPYTLYIQTVHPTDRQTLLGTQFIYMSYTLEQY